METLDKLNTGQSAVIAEVKGEPETCFRLRELGIIEGARVHMIRRAPLGDPVVFNIKGYELALRKRDISEILITDIEDSPLRREQNE